MESKITVKEALELIRNYQPRHNKEEDMRATLGRLLSGHYYKEEEVSVALKQLEDDILSCTLEEPELPEESHYGFTIRDMAMFIYKVIPGLVY